MKRSFDLIGDIAIIETETKKEETELVQKILATYPRVKCILRKESAVQGRHRTKKFRIVYKDAAKVKAAGMGSTETIHVENGCRFFLDVRKVFFNPREATIRKTLTELVTPGERVLVMFAGIAPYPIEIARTHKCRVTAIEKNPHAVRYAQHNIRLNKVQDLVTLYEGDVRQATGQFDRIIMPLGREAYKYLNAALACAHSGTIIHLYGLGKPEDGYAELIGLVQKAADKAKASVRIVDKRVVLPFAPRIDKICLDILVV